MEKQNCMWIACDRSNIRFHADCVICQGAMNQRIRSSIVHHVYKSGYTSMHLLEYRLSLSGYDKNFKT